MPSIRSAALGLTERMIRSHRRAFTKCYCRLIARTWIRPLAD